MIRAKKSSRRGEGIFLQKFFRFKRRLFVGAVALCYNLNRSSRTV
ncbi:hypothetical protein HMPREF7215_1850 [Pyramidobacter piscolens W5455]|uniref:Uncharacterized protein n=1 Tax=Pyramidobacter piscolens W5455 TaxID=352165 RepID=A0ABM9ZV51_9BACT|nr:hypothetical protein HMPREF7215_1850 [Pyramidobacter piscolens W5455]